MRTSALGGSGTNSTYLRIDSGKLRLSILTQSQFYGFSKANPELEVSKCLR